MGITDIFKNSNEKKLMDKLAKMDYKKLESKKSFYLRYERMRQSWNHEKSTGLYHKIKKGEYITDKDIADAKSYSLRGGNIQNTEEFKFYFNILEGIVKTQETSLETKFIDMNKEIQVKKDLIAFSDKLSENILKLKNLIIGLIKSYNDTLQKEAMDCIDKVRTDYKKYNAYLEEIRQLFEVNNKKRNSDEFKNNYIATKNRLRVAEELQNWMYGENNFYKKGFKKIFNDYKDIYDLITKCDKNKFCNCINKYNKKSIAKESDFILTTYFSKLDLLAHISAEAFGEDDKFRSKIYDLNEGLNNLMYP